MNLETKISNSIEILKKSEKLALSLNSFGYHLAFSGGKDSQVIYELAKMADVKFNAYFYKTSIDAPELLTFIRNNYSDVEWLKPNETMYQIILRKRMLPTRKMRFCCEVLKERQGLNSVVIVGLRKSESLSRSKRKEMSHSCVNGQDKFLLSPILEWTTNDVWNFLKLRNINVCSLYSEFHRIGCIGCPMNNKSQRKELEMYPNFKKAYLNTIKKLMLNGLFSDFENENDVLKWWTSGISKKRYMASKLQMSIDFCCT
jgi:phosphoadenosine phosphosulfate reductase